jgi:hypothetical protein
VDVIPEALDLPPGSQPWKRSVDGRISALQVGAERSQESIYNSLTALSNTVRVLGEQITALPVVRVYGGNNIDSFALTGTFTQVAAFSFMVPPDKPRTRLFISVNAAALDTVSSGVASAYGRINFGGVLSPTFPPAKATDTAGVNNIVTGSYFYNFSLIPSAYYTIKFEMYGTNASAYPKQAQNFAALNATITHTGN